jgi:hypothetical protein|tara:strand:- start:109 stop:315 length:207 start_codon:yes stop_codon:yes gene_type:complete
VDSLDFLVYTPLIINFFSGAVPKRIKMIFLGCSVKDKFKSFGAVGAQFETFSTLRAERATKEADRNAA